MKFIITADWHIRATRPRCRIDNDWIDTQRQALMQIIKIAKDKQASVYVVGDIFHSNTDTSFECINLVQKMSYELGALYILAGNHDLPYHSSENLNKSAIGVLLDSNNVRTIKQSCEGFSASNFDEVDDLDAEIVFKHTLTFESEKDMPPNVKAKTAQDLLNEFPKAKWIFTGDMHKNFHYENKRRHVINSGCLLRQVSDFKNYQCGVYFVDTDDEIVEFIPIIDNKQLIDDSYIIKEKEREERIEKFTNKLNETQEISLDFIENVNKSIEKNKLDNCLVDIIKELIMEV